jgi:hypothetical protein
VSNFDGVPGFHVVAEHLPGHRHRLWLGEPHSGTDLGTFDRGTPLWPEAQRRVGEHLGLPDGSYYVDVTIPRPDFVVDGGRVVVTDPRDGRRVEGTVITWVDGEVWVDAGDDIAGGMYAPHEITFLSGERSASDELT